MKYTTLSAAVAEIHWVMVVILPCLLQDNLIKKLTYRYDNWQGKKIAMTLERNINNKTNPSMEAACMHKVGDNKRVGNKMQLIRF